MTFYVENETEREFSFDVENVARQIAEAVLDMEECPYEAQINVLLTDNERIREFNRTYRQIDKETDVLSFPNIGFDTPGDFSPAEEAQADCFDPDSGELILGDIIVSVDKVEEQAESYGHSQMREFAFLIAHSMYHLCGYDHMEPGEASLMEKKQEEALKKLKITRDN